jgi:hypothetical protein
MATRGRITSMLHRPYGMGLATDSGLDAILDGSSPAVALKIDAIYWARWCRRLWAVGAAAVVESLVSEMEPFKGLHAIRIKAHRRG